MTVFPHCLGSALLTSLDATAQQFLRSLDGRWRPPLRPRPPPDCAPWVWPPPSAGTADCLARTPRGSAGHSWAEHWASWGVPLHSPLLLAGWVSSASGRARRPPLSGGVVRDCHIQWYPAQPFSAYPIGAHLAASLDTSWPRPSPFRPSISDNGSLTGLVNRSAHERLIPVCGMSVILKTGLAQSVPARASGRDFVGSHRTGAAAWARSRRC